jgi:hypothetical protein
MVKQPHTCGTLEVRHMHSQCTAKYLGRRIVSIMWADSDITIDDLIEAIVTPRVTKTLKKIINK